MWDPPRTGIKPVSPELVGRLFSMEPPEKPLVVQLLIRVLTLCDPTDCRLLCPLLSPGVCSDSCPSSWWCHPTSSSSAAPFSSCRPTSVLVPLLQLLAGWLWTSLISWCLHLLIYKMEDNNNSTCFITVVGRSIQNTAWHWRCAWWQILFFFKDFSWYRLFLKSLLNFLQYKKKKKTSALYVGFLATRNAGS